MFLYLYLVNSKHSFFPAYRRQPSLTGPKPIIRVEGGEYSPEIREIRWRERSRTEIDKPARADPALHNSYKARGR